MMSMHPSNPYAIDTPEHMLWARWHRAFFHQPIHGQLLSFESQLRQSLHAAFHLSSDLASSEAQLEMRAHLLEIEESINLLAEVAEHAFFGVISHNPSSLNGRSKP